MTNLQCSKSGARVDVNLELRHDMAEAERKAWRALGQYKFMMFGYWAAVWVHLNRTGNFKKPNPFGPAVVLAREICEESERDSVRALKSLMKGGSHE